VCVCTILRTIPSTVRTIPYPCKFNLSTKARRSECQETVCWLACGDGTGLRTAAHGHPGGFASICATNVVLQFCGRSASQGFAWCWSLVFSTRPRLVLLQTGAPGLLTLQIQGPGKPTLRHSLILGKIFSTTLDQPWPTLASLARWKSWLANQPPLTPQRQCSAKGPEDPIDMRFAGQIPLTFETRRAGGRTALVCSKDAGISVFLGLHTITAHPSPRFPPSGFPTPRPLSAIVELQGSPKGLWMTPGWQHNGNDRSGLPSLPTSLPVRAGVGRPKTQNLAWNCCGPYSCGWYCFCPSTIIFKGRVRSSCRLLLSTLPGAQKSQ
jgi:hypothetical protein